MMNNAKKIIDDKKNASGKRKSSILVSRLSNQTFFVLIFIEIIVLVLLLYIFFIKGAYTELDSVRGDLLPTRQTEYENMNNKYTEFLSINDSFKTLKPEIIAKAKTVLPSEAELPDTIAILDNITSKNGFELKSVDVGIFDEDGKVVVPVERVNSFGLPKANRVDPKLIESRNLGELEDKNQEQKLKIVEFDLKITGSGYSSFKRFMTMTEKSLRLFDVVGFEFSSVDESFSVKLRAYYL
ncbi:MAG: hypothetical protein ABIA91_03645 [Patescibacteria group bacterium]